MASGDPAGLWQVVLDEGGDTYVATINLPDQHDAQLLFRLPRRTVDEAVLVAASIALELTPEGHVAVYADGGGVVGFGYVGGRRPQQAELIAAFDALLQVPSLNTHIEREVIEPLAHLQRERREIAARKVARTRVEFFTMVRGG